MAGLNVSESADLLGFFYATICKVYREWYEKEITSGEKQFFGRKCFVNPWGEWSDRFSYY